MAKGRMLQNRISKSHKLASLSSDTVRLLYTWMLSHLDINGSFYADPVMVNNLVFTRLGHPVKIVAAALDELDQVGLIVRFKIDDEVYLNYPDFDEKQPKLYPEREGNPDIPKLTPASIIINSCVTQTQSKVKEIKVKESKVNADFDIFYKAYPKKVNKKEAIAAWNKATLPCIGIILSAIERQKKSDQWINDNGKYIPYPASWINKERWDDELTHGGNGNGTGQRINDARPGAKEWKPETRPENSSHSISQVAGLVQNFLKDAGIAHDED